MACLRATVVWVLGAAFCLACESQAEDAGYGGSGSGGSAGTSSSGGSAGASSSGGSAGASSSGGSAGASSSGGSAGTSSSGGSAGTSSSGGAGGAGSGGASGSGGAGGSAGSVGAQDADADGLDDADEDRWAHQYFPFYSLNPGDSCPRHGVVYRVAPHPADAAKLMIWFDVLYEKDCGSLGHDGDDEVFGVVADPAVPAPAGLLAVRTISHQGTLCERKTTCGSLPGCTACEQGTRDGASYPVVYSSKNKHGSYGSESSCDGNFICDGIDGCAKNATADAPVFVNAGEPGHPLCTNLTTQGFINAGGGWTVQGLMNFNPWGNTDFGGAGNVTLDLDDQTFVVAPTGC